MPNQDSHFGMCEDPLMAGWTHERARVANAIRHHPGDTEAIAAARRDLEYAKLAERIAAKAPLFTAAQRAQLTTLLAGGDDAA